MRPGGDDITRQLNKGADFIQTSFQASQGIVSPITSTFIFKGVVIEVNFERLQNYLNSSMKPPFSVYAKLIGWDEDVADPDIDNHKIFYPPLFPMHSICIPEIGEEVLILKESAEYSAQGYYVGRVNDSSFLNVNYARSWVGNQRNTSNISKYGFSFDVKELREAHESEMPSGEFNNFSIPMTYGDVVQQGRSKTYLRHSFNKNNKEGVLEQGIRNAGQLMPNDIKSSYQFVSKNPSSIPATPVVTKGMHPNEIQQLWLDGHIASAGNSDTPANPTLNSYDPSIGSTRTKTIHFVDTSIKRLGDYSIKSDVGGDVQDNIEGEEKSIIANVADEIYNISSKNNENALYRHVLGENLIKHQQETSTVIKEMLTQLGGMSKIMDIFLQAFLEHEHALPKIELNLDKSVKQKDNYMVPAKYEDQEPEVINVPSRKVRVKVGTRVIGRCRRRKVIPKYSYTTVPGFTRTIERPPKIVTPATMKTRFSKQKINFEAIIGGKEDPRFTAPVETDNGDLANPSSLGMKTGIVHTASSHLADAFEEHRKQLDKITKKASQYLSKNQFVN